MRNLPALLQSVRMVVLHASLADGLAMEATAYCADGAGAKQVHDSLRGIVGLARFGLPEKQKAVLMPLLDGIEVVQKETEATLRARLTVEQFSQMQAALPAPKPAD
jgi:hypothetical protein